MSPTAVTPNQFSTFGDLVKHLRRLAHLTQMELAIAVGYSDAQISRIEKNQRTPDAATITALFVPALGLENDSKWMTRLLELAKDKHQSPLYNSQTNGTPHNLPHQLTSFIGREKEIAEVTDLLRAHHLITLTGPGGTGKPASLSRSYPICSLSILMESGWLRLPPSANLPWSHLKLRIGSG